MNDERLSELSLEAFLHRLSTHDPVPGGGSAAALAGAMAASLLHMVVELTAGRSPEADRDKLREIGAAAASWQSELLKLAELDASAYATVVQARRMPRGTEREAEARRVHVMAATREATRVPLEVARRSRVLLELAERLVPIGNRNAISDVGVAGLLGVAAMRGAALNVRINLPFLPEDDPLRTDAAAEIEALLAGLDDRDRAIQAAVRGRLA